MGITKFDTLLMVATLALLREDGGGGCSGALSAFWYCRSGLSGCLPQLQASRFVGSDLLSPLDPRSLSPLPFRERTEGRVSNRQVTKRCDVTEIRVICLSSVVSNGTGNNHCRLPASMKDVWKILV